jgi:ATP-dependent RNA helicase SUPV3L1/SUV3
VSGPLPDFAGGRITALLGPTNTGKTHRAVEQLLRHRTGMMGFPLRLLAREIYDRVTARVGEASVALITGEERRVPPGPRYFICTVESMPVSRPVDFLAVDEVQLASHVERGHIYTDRLLGARGVRETMFLGSDAFAPMMEQLVPTAEIRQHERLSKLSYAGVRRLSALPPRSAVVAFSASAVYELAERLRGRHGGVAVVMGALSPRTRNAQVAMYQSGEVPVMVATDAIGMGLNMDIDHVAFAGLWKFDGREYRPLTAAEVGQIAGRAGRWRKDGSFGPTGDVEAMDPDLVRAVESHRFEPVRRVRYRNSDLDTGSVEALLESLRAPPPRRFMTLARGAQDEQALEQLVADGAVAARAVGADAVETLWEVCRIPDFRKTLTGDHVQLLSAIYRQLVDGGRLAEDWLAERVGRLDRVDGDIETLMTRIAWIRTWTYVSFRRDWVPDPEGWQGRTRAIEDRLSDALHERLTRRFVDRLAGARGSGRRAQLGGGVEVGEDGAVTAMGERLGELKGFSLQVAPSLRPRDQIALQTRASELLGPGLADRVQRLVQAPDTDFAVDARGQLRWGGGPIGELARGEHPAAPAVSVLPSPLLGPGARGRIERRLTAWTRDRAAALLAPLEAPPARRLGPPAAALVEDLRRWLGVLPREVVDPEVFSKGDRKRLAALGVRFGTLTVYAAPLLSGATLSLRALLACVFFEQRPIPRPPDGGRTALDLDRARPPGLYLAMGFLPLGPLAVRVDVAEKLAARLRAESRGGPFAIPEEVASWLGAAPEALEGVARDLGYRPAGEGRFARREQRSRGRRG